MRKYRKHKASTQQLDKLLDMMEAAGTEILKKVIMELPFKVPEDIDTLSSGQVSIFTKRLFASTPSANVRSEEQIEQDARNDPLILSMRRSLGNIQRKAKEM